MLAKRFEQARCREQRVDGTVLENEQGLIDHMLHVILGLIHFLVGDDLLHPARIKIDEVARATHVVGEVLDGESQTSRAGRTHHEPVSTSGKGFGIERLGKLLVVDFVVVPLDALFGHSGGSPRFEDVEGAIAIGLGHPLFMGKLSQQFAIEVGEAKQVGVAGDFTGGIPT